MIDLSDKYFMMIEPDGDGEPTTEPVDDELTGKVDYIFSKCTPSRYCYRGFHMTRCGKFSDNHDWILCNGMITNNLCTYYIRHYRKFIPKSEIEKINGVYDEITKKNEHGMGRAGSDMDDDIGKIKQGLGLSDFDTRRAKKITMNVVNNVTGKTVISTKMPNREASTKEKLTSLILQMDGLSVKIYVDKENLNKLVNFNKQSGE